MTTWLPTPAAFAFAAAPHRNDRRPGPDPHLARWLRRSLALGVMAVILVPALRGSSDWLGWLPLWLVGMPAVAWWALHRFRLPPAAGWAAALRRLRPHRQARWRAPARPCNRSQRRAWTATAPVSPTRA